LVGLALLAVLLITWIAQLFGYVPTYTFGDYVIGPLLAANFVCFVWFWIAAWWTRGLMKPEERGWK